MTKNKHDHTATKKIKAWLFAIMLLLPFLFLIPTGLYYGLNQNAQLSEITEQQPVYYDSNQVNSINDIIIDNIYKYDGNYQQVNIGSEGSICFVDVNLMKQQFTSLYELDLISTRFYYVPNSHLRLLYVYNDNGTERSNTYNISNIQLYFIPISMNQSIFQNTILTNVSYTDYEYIKEYTPVTTSNDISTSIINAWNSTWQNPLFSWTNYSPFYAPMQNFTNVFGINDMQIANVLTYLATITAIYIVFDIIIELFTYLTHLIPRSD